MLTDTALGVDILDSLVNILRQPSDLWRSQKFIDVSNLGKKLSINTITYLSYLEDAFIVEKAIRYDVKGRKYIQTPHKYYFTDVGLRNARLNFRQQEESHLMENLIYNELIIRGYNVDVGLVEVREGDLRKQTEVDFVCNQGNNRCYIQSTLHWYKTKDFQESQLWTLSDNFKKIIIVKDAIKHWRTEKAYWYLVFWFSWIPTADL